MFPFNDRTVKSLKRNFAALHRRKVPTKVPLMPADVRRAKHIRYKITYRAETRVMDEGNENEFLPPDDALPSTSNDGNSFTKKISLEEEENSNLCAMDPESFILNLKCQPTPRPLVHRRSTSRASDTESDNLLEILRSQIVQEGIRGDEKCQQREEDWKLGCERYEAEAMHHECFMEMLMTVPCHDVKATDRKK